MQNSRTKNSLLIMVTSGFRQGITLILAFISRTIFIHILGAEYLGLNGLFSNILSILALSELGIGTAISFYLYKPLVNCDIERIKSLMYFYKLCYRFIGILIICIGICIMPFLHLFVNFEQDIQINLYIVFGLNVLNTSVTYLFFAYKQTLIIANQEQYKVEKLNILFTILSCILDVVVLVIFRDFIVYLVSKIVITFIKNMIIAYKIDLEYTFLKDKDYGIIKREEIKLFFKDVKNVALFKIGSTLFNATDNIIISMLVGTLAVGYYSNYHMIISQMAILISLMVNSFVSGIGNVIAKEDKKKQYNIFSELNFIVYFVVSICTICLFHLLNPFIMLWVGNVDEKYILSQCVVAFLCINFYIDGTTQIPNSFREASGNFAIGKSLQIIGGIVNIFLSIFMGKVWGLEGIFCATIVSKIFITVIPFFIGISKSVFEKKEWFLLIIYFSDFLKMMLVAIIVWIVFLNIFVTSFAGFVLKCLLSVLISSIAMCLVNIKRTEMGLLLTRIFKLL